MAESTHEESPDIGEKKRPSFPFVFNFRTILYALTFFLIFATTVAELGLVSWLLHTHGEGYENYPNKQYKHAIGLLLFSSILSLPHCPATRMDERRIHVLCGTRGSGVLWYGCGPHSSEALRSRAQTVTGEADQWVLEWQPYAGDCGKVVAIQGLAWALWALCIFLLIGTLVHKFDIRARPTPEGFYFSKAS
ncbi:hypothetical protein BKA70DRAFT_1435956 [Coprinopsis sp. MPI-PUGE-AT-0042]|nr:hypothetical protein BKA70DRAFT_1435956 [Coprinopsis sp. MPI-PUGE-AT-0042]